MICSECGRRCIEEFYRPTPNTVTIDRLVILDRDRFAPMVCRGCREELDRLAWIDIALSVIDVKPKRSNAGIPPRIENEFPCRIAKSLLDTAEVIRRVISSDNPIVRPLQTRQATIESQRAAYFGTSRGLNQHNKKKRYEKT